MILSLLTAYFYTTEYEKAPLCFLKNFKENLEISKY